MSGAPGLLLPDYGARSLSDVLPAVGQALGVDARLAPTALHLPEAAGYVLFLVDGMGLEQLRAHPDDAPYLCEAVAASADPALTVGVPTTTATSLTSLGTGRHPAEHGVLGYTTRIPGSDRLLNSLKWDDSVDPERWQPHRTAWAELQAAGVDVTVVSKSDFERSGLTRSANRGVPFVGADDIEAAVEAGLAAVAATSGPSLTYLYESDLDVTGHLAGVDSHEWRAQLCHVDETVERLRERLPDDVRLLVVADHGMVDVPPETRIDVDAEPGLQDGVVLIGGEARLRHVYCRTGAEADVAAAWAAVLGDRAVVRTRDAALREGWFGQADPVALPRLGDVVVAATGRHALMSPSRFAVEDMLVGFHGSLTREEMLAPLLVL